MFIQASASVFLSFVLALGLGGWSAGSASALDSGWAETEGGRMRIVIDPEPSADGRLRGALDIDLDAGWKTYWKDPGGSGIPPLVDLGTSTGLVLDEIGFPPPVRIDDGYSVWAGYTQSVRLPLLLRRTSAGAATLDANVFIGICDKVCVPFQAHFRLPVPEGASSDAGAIALVAEAWNALPSAPTVDFRVSDVQRAPDWRRFSIAVTLPGFRPKGAEAELFVAGPAGWAFGPPETMPAANGSAVFEARIERHPKDADLTAPLPLDVTVTYGARSFATRLDLR